MRTRRDGTLGVLPLSAMLVILGACDPVNGSELRSQGDQIVTRQGENEELLSDLAQVEEKVVALAEVLQQSEYDWRPGEGVRSAGEVFMHVVTLNFVSPVIMGHEQSALAHFTLETIPREAPRFEGSLQARDDILPVLTGSFEYIRGVLEATSDVDLGRDIVAFGRSERAGRLWTMHFGHLNQHLGQLIAYARMNGIAAPWS